MDDSIKLLIFDFDGTLANTVPHIVNCIIKCTEKYNLTKISYDEAEKYKGTIFEHAIKELGATDEQLPEIKKYYHDIFFDDISDIKLYDNTLSTLKELKEKGYAMAIASNRGRNTMNTLLKALGIDSFFEMIVCSGDVENKKPCPDMIELILKELHYSNDETLVLGDTKYDILMGYNANCKACYVCHDEKPNDDILKLNPDIIIYNFKELVNQPYEFD